MTKIVPAAGLPCLHPDEQASLVMQTGINMASYHVGPLGLAKEFAPVKDSSS